MRFDQIIPRLTPGADYTFATTTQTYLSRRAGETGYTERTEEVYIYDDYAAIIWNDGVIPQPTLAECEAEWQAILAERQAEIGALATIDKAVSWLTSRNYKAAYDNVGASVNIPAELKTYLQELIKGQAAIATALNQIDTLIDMDNLA